MAKHKDKEVKTNAMRILDKNKISYETINYECDEFIDGLHTAEKTGAPVEQSFKTLVAQGKSKEYYVLVIPIAEEVDLKKAAKVLGRKINRNDSCKRYYKSNRLCSWRMQSAWYEKAISDDYSGKCRNL